MAADECRPARRLDGEPRSRQSRGVFIERPHPRSCLDDAEYPRDIVRRVLGQTADACAGPRARSGSTSRDPGRARDARAHAGAAPMTMPSRWRPVRWRPFPRAPSPRRARRCRCPAPINAYHAHPGRAHRLQGDLPVRRRRRRRIARPARPRHQHPRRRARPTCGASPTSTALPLLVDVDTGLGARVQHRAHRQVADQGRRRRACTSKTRSAPSAAAIGPARSSCRSDEMVDRIKAAVDARTDPDFVDHGAHRRARRRRPRRGDRPRAAPTSRPAPT